MGQDIEKMHNETEFTSSSQAKDGVKCPKVSIVVPVYNSEKYLSRCLKALTEQTLKEIEIIIVNDGSTDNSSDIISKFEKEDNRIKVINQENKLQGSARNNGVKNAVGEYIGFVDSDDWIDLDYFEKLYKSAVKYNSDIALATNIRIGNGKTKKRLNIAKEEFVSNLQDKFDICNLSKNPCPTNKIYKLEMLKKNNIKWPEGCYCEDKLFVTQAVYYANGIVSVPDINYYYFRNPNSTVNNKAKEHSKKIISDKNKARSSVVKFLREQNAQIRDKEFWAIKKEYKFLGICIYRIKESIHTQKHLLFGIIPVYEAKGAKNA